MITKVMNVHVRKSGKKVYKRPNEKMKITCKETVWRGKGSLCYFNINSFAFNSIGKAFTVSCRPQCRASVGGGGGTPIGIAPSPLQEPGNQVKAMRTLLI